MKTLSSVVATQISKPTLSAMTTVTSPGSTWNVTTSTTQLSITITSTLNSTTSTAAPGTTTVENATLTIYPEEVTSGHMFSYVLIPLGAVACALVITALVFFMLKKSRLDKLRHHLMPLYNFDPAEEEEDWETELLEEGLDHRNGPRAKCYHQGYEGLGTTTDWRVP